MTAKSGSFSSPGDQAIAVAPSDTVPLTAQSRALYIGTGGDLTVVMGGPDANTVLFPGVPSGTTLPIIVKQVMATGTSASGIVSIY